MALRVFYYVCISVLLIFLIYNSVGKYAYNKVLLDTVLGSYIGLATRLIAC